MTHIRTHNCDFYFSKHLKLRNCVLEIMTVVVNSDEAILNVLKTCKVSIFGHIMLYTNLHKTLSNLEKQFIISSIFTDCCLLHLTGVPTMIVDLWWMLLVLCSLELQILLLVGVVVLLQLKMRLFRRLKIRCFRCLTSCVW